MKDFDMTAEELANFESQMKDPTFKSLFFDYLNDIQNPKNKQLYEEEIAKLEAENGNKVRFINPSPGFCIKSFVKDGKVFVNLCSSPEVDEMVVEGEKYSIPYSLSKPKKELDNAKKDCLVYDVVFNPKAMEKGLENAKFKHILILTAIEGIEKQFGVEIKRDYVLMKNMKVKGGLSRTMIREKLKSPAPKPEADETSLKFLEKIMAERKNELASAGKVTPANELAPAREGTKETIPKFKIVHQNLIQDYQSYLNDSSPSSRPQSLHVKIEIPLVKSISDVDLDLNDGGLDLLVKDLYKLHLDLPFPTINDKAVAKFEKRTGLLSVTVPVLQLEVASKVLVADQVDDKERLDIKQAQSLQDNNEKLVEEVKESLSDNANHIVKTAEGQTKEISVVATVNKDSNLEELVSNLEINGEEPAVDNIPSKGDSSTSEEFHDTKLLESAVNNLKLGDSSAVVDSKGNPNPPTLEDISKLEIINNNGVDDAVEIGDYLNDIQPNFPVESTAIPLKTHQSADSLTIILDTTSPFKFHSQCRELLLKFEDTKMTLNFPSDIGNVSYDVNDYNTCILIEKSSKEFWEWITVDGLEHRFPSYDIPESKDTVTLSLETRVNKDGVDVKVTKSGDLDDSVTLFANDLVFELD